MALQSSFSSSSSSSFSYAWTFNVFLSFRGTDTRHGFTGNLYKTLCDRGIHTFIDDEELQRGDEITPSLVKAIQGSRIAIPVFSNDYASSSFCLDEVATIMECVKGNGRLVFPVFYDVDPSHVKRQEGTYGEALARHEERFKDDKDRVQKWREALYQAANLAGKHVKPGKEYEYAVIEKIVKVISNKISRVPLHVADYPVGLDSRVLKVIHLLNDGLHGEVHMVGIHGIGGIGKTTLARQVYNFVADQFESLCFLENVRENSIKHGLPHLQEMLLSKILGEKDIKLASVGEGTSRIKHRFQSKKVLLVLDDVDTLEQLQAIVGSTDWFGPGSRVIITTRDEHLLAAHGVKRKYEVEGLNEKEALELLRWNAFKREKVEPNDYMDILNKVVSYASGLPLALVVIGSNLFGRREEEWISALSVYKKIPHKDIQKILKVSFDALEEYEKKFFLDIACCFRGYQLSEVENILQAHHDVNPKFGIRVLVERSLIKIEYGVVRLHDLIQDMGREIVRQESPKNPGKRSRLWLPEEIKYVLQENKGSSEVEMIIPDAPLFEVIEWDEDAFKKMENLKTLILHGRFSKAPKHLPNSLRVLKWREYPSHFLPFDFHPKELAILKLPESCIMPFQLVNILKNFANMRELDLSWNKQITQIPNVSCALDLEKLYLRGCKNLTEIDESVGSLVKLKILDVESCVKLRSLPSLLLPSLEELILLGCSSLESFPEIFGKIEKLTNLDLSDTCIKELPHSIRNITRLQHISLGLDEETFLYSNGNLVLPRLDCLSIGEPECLQSSNQDECAEQLICSTLSSNATKLEMTYCNISDEFLQIILPRFPSLQELDLAYCNLTILPACIKDCLSLRRLNLDGCRNLQEIRGIPPNIEYLTACDTKSISDSSRRMLLNKKFHEEGVDKGVVLPGTSIPEWFELQSSTHYISFWFRNKFPAISLCFLVEPEHGENIHWSTLELIINGTNEFRIHKEKLLKYSSGRIYFYDKNEEKFRGGVDEVLLKNKWNQAVICITKLGYVPDDIIKQFRVHPHGIRIGVHINEKRSSKDDIRFTNPLLDQYGRELRLCLPHQEVLDDSLNWDSNSKLISSTTTSVTDGDCGIASRKEKSGLALDLNKEPSEMCCHAIPKVDLGLDSISSRLANDIPNEGDRGIASRKKKGKLALDLNREPK